MQYVNYFLYYLFILYYLYDSKLRHFYVVFSVLHYSVNVTKMSYFQIRFFSMLCVSSYSNNFIVSKYFLFALNTTNTLPELLLVPTPIGTIPFLNGLLHCSMS
nr:MAG TPA: hypothetical protein [Bacteriophage sp.]